MTSALLIRNARIVDGTGGPSQQGDVAVRDGRIAALGRDLPAQGAVIGDVNNRHLGVLDLHGQPKPAADALRFFRRAFRLPCRCADERIDELAGNGSVQAHAFEFVDGSAVLCAWLPTHAGPLPAPAAVPILVPPPATQTVQFRLTGLRLHEAELCNELGEAITDSDLQRAPRSLRCHADSTGTTLSPLTLQAGEIAVVLLR